MATRLLTDSTTRTTLGDETLAELRANLRAVDCQTCGRPFGRWEKPALVVQTVADVGDVSLHHSGCRRPEWLAAGEHEVAEFPHVTWRAKLVLLTGGVFAFVVNPYYEFAVLRMDGGRWRVATLDQFATYGMGTDLLDGVRSQPSLSAVVDEDGMSVRITHDGAVRHEWRLDGQSFSPSERKVLALREWLTVAVTTALDPRKSLRGNPLPGLSARRRVRLGAAEISYTEQAQQLRKSDIDNKKRLELIGLTCEVIRRTLGVEVEEGLIVAALACHYGDSSIITSLSGRNRLLAMLLVGIPHAISQKHPPPGGGIHVMAADPAACYKMFAALAEISATTVVRLAAEPTAAQRRAEYLADIVVGTPEQFHAAYTFYRDDAGDWSQQQSRGHLAMLVGVDRPAFGDRYPKVVAV